MNDIRATSKGVQLTTLGMLYSFLSSRGGLIALSVVFAIVCRFGISHFGILDLLVMIAIVVAWPVLEWFFHRFLMHEWTALPFHFTHDRHHNEPTPWTGMPDAWIIAFYFIDTIVFWGLGLQFLSSANIAVLTMLTLYELVHFSCHCNYRPVTAWGWAIRTNHLKHHNFDDSQFYSMLFPAFGKTRSS